MGDGLGVLHDMMKLKAKDPVLTNIAAELALTIAPLGFVIRAAHLWSERNEVCDHLSRLKQGELHNLAQLSSAKRSVRAAAHGAVLQIS